MALVFLLIIFGLVMLSSAGVVEGQKKFDSSYYHVKHQFLFGVLPGLLVFLLASKINYKNLRKLALLILVLVVSSMVLVFIPKLGLSIRGAQRWVNIGSLSFQPAEFLKLAIIIYLAAWLSRHKKSITSGNQTLTPFIMVLAFVGLLLLLQPDIKTLVLIVVISVSMYFFAGAKVLHIMIFGVLMIALLAILSIAPYRLDRIRAYLNPSQDTQGVAYHVNQAQIGIGSGGIFGLGYGQSKQKFNYLPEPVGDSIFAIIIEELGFVGGVILLTVFILLMLSLVGIAFQTDDQFGRLMVLGITVWVIGQAFVNMAAILNLIPLTGAPLPFISFGSSSLVAIMASMGIALNVSKSI